MLHLLAFRNGRSPISPFGIFLGGALLGCLLNTFAWAQPGPSPAQPIDPPAEKGPLEAISPFQYPARAEAARRMMTVAVIQARQGNAAEALQLCQRSAEVAPFIGETHYNLACMQALADESENALASLAKAIDAGFADARLMAKDDDLKSLRDEPRFEQLVARAKQRALAPPPPQWPAATPVKDGVALVSRENSAWDPRTGLVRIAFELPPVVENVSPEKPPVVVLNQGEAAKKIAEWYGAGAAAGNHGDYYDNCDRDHSNMRKQDFPQLTFIEYAPEVANETGYGLQVTRIYNGVVIGNSSTAQTAGPYWRSNPRRAYVQPSGPAILAYQYANNHLYFYPEHRDHDPGYNGKGPDGTGQGFGDVYPANTPYMVISQGSSGSDRAFLNAFACALAALRPEVKEKLIAEGATMPTLQRVFRQSNKVVEQPGDYLTGAAHPTVFDSKNLNVMKMVELANAITLETLPPIAALQVVAEDRPRPGIDYFDAGERERLFDTPGAAARIWRSTAYKRTYVLSAAPSRDLNDNPLKFHWVLLRGDAASVEIKPLDEAGNQAEITLTWQPRRPIAPDSEMESNRIDIGLFADNGVQLSAPAFFCVNTLDNEVRQYNEAGQIQSVVYTGAAEKGNYVDPAFDLPKSWKDDYRYDSHGALLGWTRTRGDQQEHFTADGALVEQRDDNDRPTVARTVGYVAEQKGPNQPPVLKQVLGTERLYYEYADAKDQRGRIERRETVMP